jgi:hypothetical protein
VPGSQEPTAPPTMPPAGDVESCELPMPTVEEEAERKGWWQTIAGWFKTAKACEEPAHASRTVPASELADWFECMREHHGECREDKDYHHHYPGCPYTGLSFPGWKGGDPAAMPPLPMKDNGCEEPSEERAPSSALKTIRKIKGRMSIPEDRGPVAPGVDTMELRMSDLPLYDYGPGVL